MSTSKPYFSIIIPTLNEEKAIALLLLDLAHQNFTDYEIIVVDAKSIDQTRILTQTIGKKNKLPLKIVKCSTANVNHQRNLGSLHAKSNLLVFCDADNRLESTFLKKLQESYIHNKYKIIIPQMSISSSMYTLSDKIIILFLNLFYQLEKLFSNRPQIVESVMLIEKSTYSLVGGLNELLFFHEGRDFLSRAKKFGISYTLISKPKYFFSLRRYYKYGIFRMMINNFLSIYMNNNFDYHPMQGGKMYD